MVRLVRKLYAERAGGYIATIAGEIGKLDEIDLDIADLDLSVFEQRAIRVFARRHRGARCELRPLGGLSGAKTFGLSVFDSDDSRRALAFGKIAGRGDVEDEERRFQQFVSVHLDPTCLPVLVGHVLSGAGRRAALFYSFADGFDRSLFDVLEEGEAAALDVLSAVRQATEPWHNTNMIGDVSVEDIRRFGLADDAMEVHGGLIDDIDWRSIESRSFEVRVGPQHGDLHGKNLLVDGSGRVILIDFGDVDRRPLGLDPVVLELSLFFHPDRPRSDYQPSVAECSSWADVDVFADATPFSAFVRACRTWAIEAAGSEAVVLALAYAHAVRQLKYADTDEQMAVAVARSALTRLNDLNQSSG